MKKSLKILSLSLLTSLSLVGVVTSSLAWYYERANLNQDVIRGASAGAYFAYGDGSADHPYGINHPRHLYNLSWLNMDGYFEGKTVYFELDPTLENGVLDCEGYVIPPIGTEEHPFMGNFNGHNCAITNLTVTNDTDEIEDFGKHPYNAFAAVGSNSAIWPSTDPQIVGLFGVVGSITTPCTTVSTTNEIVDLGIENVTIKTTSTQTLVGIAAGYLNGNLDNVSINNCTLDISSGSTKINKYNNVSNYSMVGFAENVYLKKLSKKQYTVEVPEITHSSGPQGGSDWNASIDMKSMFNRLKSLYTGTNTLTRTQYQNYEHRVIDGQGNVEVIDADSTYADAPSFTASNTTGYYASATTTDNNQNTVASYTFAMQNGNTRFMYLYGDTDTDKVVNNGLSVRNDYTFDAIHDDSGNYLTSTSNTAIGNTTSLNNTNAINYAKWTLDSSGHLKNGGRNVYLYASSNTAVATSTSVGTGTNYVWSFDSTNNRLSTTYNNTTRYLVYRNGNWSLVSATDTYAADYYVIKTSTGTAYYLNVTWNGTTPTLRASTTSNGTKWYMDGNYYYVLRDGSTTKYYLNYGSNTVRVSNSTSNRFRVDGSNRLYYSSGNRTYYIYVNNGNLSRSETNSSTFNISLDQITIYDHFSVYRDGAATLNTSENSYYNTQPTYYPLTFGGNNTVDDNNTGYVVSGSSSAWGDIRVSEYYTNNIGTSLNITNSTNYDDSLDKKMQVISASAATGGDFYLIQDTHNVNTTTYSNALRTNTVGINTTRKTVKEFGFKKYNSARNGLKTMLTGSSSIFGLHFMNSIISKDSLVKVPYAKVADKDRVAAAQNGENIYTEYVNENYEMPRDSIDFHLSSKGTINFFAGTYYSGNNTFFSLHSIERYDTDTTVSGVLHKAHTIKSINEIDKIYKNYYTGSNLTPAQQASNPYLMKKMPYIYLYKNGHYSIEGDDIDISDYLAHGDTASTLVFDMSWVTNPKMLTNSVYYFEIPVNKGEFALGSVSTSTTGAYLMYLDIGAASADIDTIQIREKLYVDEFYYVTPAGVDFAYVVVNNQAVTNDISGGDTMTITIPGGTTGVFAFAYSTSGENKILTCGPPSGSTITGGANVTSTFKNDDISLTATSIGTSGTVNVVATGQADQNTIYKQTVYEYSSDLATLTKTVYYSDDPGENYEDGWEEAENESSVTEDYFDYEPIDEDEIVYLGDDPLAIFHYLLLTGSADSLTMTYDYDYKEQTYSFTITNTSSEAVKIYITHILYDEDTDTQYHLKINGTEVDVGSIVTL